MRDLAIGFGARSVSVVALLPVTVIKTRFEVHKSRFCLLIEVFMKCLQSAYFSYSSLKDAAVDIAKTQKLRG